MPILPLQPGGSAVAVDLVPSHPVAAGTATPPARDALTTRRRILVVDGVPDRLAAIVAALGDGVHVAVTHAGSILPADLAAADLVLVTAADPGRAELALRVIRAVAARALPVLLASAAPPAHDARLLGAGADAVVAATADGALVETVRAMLAGRLAPIPSPSR